MKVKKMKRLRILILALCVCLIAGVAETLNMVDAYGEGEEGTTVTSHTHYICGDADCNRTTTEHSNVNFGNVLTSNGNNELLCNGTKVTPNDRYYYTLDGGNYYLQGNVTISKTIKVTGTVNLCLNGNTLTRNNGSCIYIEEEAVLNICDCGENGEITNGNSDSNTISVGEQNCKYSDKTLNLYGGKISNTSYSGQTIELYNNDDTGTTVIFNMYGGEVYKTSGQAVSVNYANTCKGKYEINIYDGLITCINGRGIDASNSKNARTLIAGGTIQGGMNALWVLGDVTLSGNPKIQCTGENRPDIDIITGGEVSEQDWLIIKDDFVPAGGSKISIDKAIGESGSVVIAQPEKSTSNLESKAQYFVSAQEGYFVDYIANGKLQLTACEITQQPTTENNCSVMANGSDGKLKYQWYSATRENVLVTENNVKDTGGCSCWNEKWDYDRGVNSQGPKNIEGFTLQMAKDDVLTMAFESMAVQSIEVYINNEPIASSDRENYTFTALDGGSYTLKIVATPLDHRTSEGYYYLNFAFTANVMKDVAKNALTGQTNAQLNTDNRCGKYICAVKWEGKTTIYSDVVELNNHKWIAATCTTPKTCSVCSKTEGNELGHDYTAETKSDDTLKTPGTCIAEAIYYYSCANCGAVEKNDSHTFIGELNARNHAGSETEWTRTATTHKEIYKCCGAVKTAETTHSFSDWSNSKRICEVCGYEQTCTNHTGGTATCKNKAVCETCGAEYGDLDTNYHAGTETEWITTATTHKEIYKCCNAVKTAETEHTWDAGVITTPATTTKEGVKTFTCEVCKATKTESVPKIPTGGGVITPPKTDTITADVTGDKTSVKITAEISGDTASIAEIGKSDIDKAGAGVDITIDLTVIPNEVVSVTVTKKSLDNIYESKSDNVSIKLTGSTVNMDRDTLKNIIDQMKGSDLKLVVDKHQDALESMNKVQQDAVKDMREPKIMDAYFISGGIRITDFKGGSVDIKIPYPDKKGVKAWYIDDNGIKEPVPVSYDGKTAVITVNHFSHYVLEEDDSDNVEPVPVKKTVDKVIYVKSAKYSKKTGTEITFNKVSGADGYYVYGNRCNTDKVYKFKKLATLKGNDNTVFVHKKTAKNTFYKYYIKAYKVVDGKRVTVSRSEEIHFVTDVKGYKYGNPTKVTLSVKKYTLSKGKTFNLKNRVKVYSSKKVLLHTDKIRYVSSDSSIAKVNSKGKITAKKAGSCNIYAIAQNGRAAKIAVTVK